MQSPSNPATRGRTIRQYVSEASELMAEAKRTRDRIRVLGSKVKHDLGMDPTDFMIAVRMHRLAQQGRQQALENVREVLLALGNAIPQLGNGQVTDQRPVTGPQVFGHQTIKEEILVTLGDGPASTSELRARNYNLRHLKSLSAHLSKLVASGFIDRDGEGKWKLEPQEALKEIRDLESQTRD